MNETIDNLPIRLRSWRGTLTQRQAASKLGVPYPTYLRWEHGDRTPSAFARAALEAVLAPTTTTNKHNEHIPNHP